VVESKGVRCASIRSGFVGKGLPERGQAHTLKDV
jgi:hypothetical protein